MVSRRSRKGSNHNQSFPGIRGVHTVMSKHTLVICQSTYANLSSVHQDAWKNWLKRQIKLTTDPLLRKALKLWRRWTQKAKTIYWHNWRCDRPVAAGQETLIETACAWLCQAWQQWRRPVIDQTSEFKLGVFSAEARAV